MNTNNLKMLSSSHSIDYNTLTAITEDAPLLIWLTDSRSRCIYVSEIWLEFTGKKLSEILGLGWTSCIHPDDLSKFSSIYFGAKEEKKNFEVECRLQRNDGKYKRILMRGNCRFDAITKDFLGYVGVGMDITSKQKELETSYGMLENLISDTQMLVVALDGEYRLILFNEAHAKVMRNLFGFEPKKGDNILEKIKHIPHAYQEMKDNWGRALNGENFTILEDFEDVEGKIRFYEVTYSPIKDNYKKIVGATAISRDITERKRQEEEIQNLLQSKISLLESLEHQNEELAMQEEEMRQTNEELFSLNNQLVNDREKLLNITDELQARNFELDQIMYKTSHDIRSPIASILGLLNLIEDEELNDTVREYITFLRKRINHLDRFTKSMLDYGKSQRADITPTQITFTKLIQECLDELKYHPNFSRIKICLNITDNSENISTDEFRLKIILSNLISNAIKYQNLHIQDSYLDIFVHCDKKNATIRLRDNGIGIDEKYLPRIGDMFFRATQKAEGSGLGMYIVKQTVKKLNGKIDINSKLNEGTQIYIELPCLMENIDENLLYPTKNINS